MPSHKLIGIGATACLTMAALSVPLATAHATGSTAAAAPAAVPGWSVTHTLALDVAGTRLGAAPAGQRLRISVALPMRHADRVASDIMARSNPSSPKYGHFLTPAQVLTEYGPTAASVRAVRAYLTREGFTHLTVAPNRLLVDASATVAQTEHAFHTSIGRYVVRGRHVYANSRPALVPTALSGKVSAVLGLSNLQMTLPHVIHKPSTLPAPVTTAAGSPNLSGFDAKQLQKVYLATKVPAARKSEIAVISIGDQAPIIKNLRFAETKEGFPKVPLKVFYTAPKQAIVDHNTLSGNAEFDLDTQLSTMMAGTVKRLDIYAISTFTDSDVARGINRFVTDNHAKSGSASLGECDVLAYADGALVTTDQMVAEGGLQGQSFFASTGDNGSFCPVVTSTGAPGGGPGQSWPAVGEYTTAVGGTTLLADKNGHVQRELAWVGGGGGISAVGTGGPWTYQVNPGAQLALYNNEGGRAVPDISADADENTGVLIYTGGKTPEEIGGTSVSAPLVMGLWSRVNNAHQGKLGLASYRFYQLYNKVNPGTIVPGLVPTYVPNAAPLNVTAFRDVFNGTNGAYQATRGWDYTTGVGTPLLFAMNKTVGKGSKK